MRYISQKATRERVDCNAVHSRYHPHIFSGISHLLIWSAHHTRHSGSLKWESGGEQERVDDATTITSTTNQLSPSTSYLLFPPNSPSPLLARTLPNSRSNDECILTIIKDGKVKVSTDLPWMNWNCPNLFVTSSTLVGGSVVYGFGSCPVLVVVVVVFSAFLLISSPVPTCA